METQKQAVVRLVKAKLGTNYDPAQSCREKLSKEDVESIRQDVVAGIKGGTITFKGQIGTDAQLSRYVIGMITNHLRKTRELNGGKKRSEIPVKKKDANAVKVGDATVDTTLLPEELANEIQG